jgi:hypothetical protein
VCFLLTGQIAVRSADDDMVDTVEGTSGRTAESGAKVRRLRRGAFIGIMRRWDEWGEESAHDYEVVSPTAECYTIKHSVFMSVFGNGVEKRFKFDQLRAIPVLMHFTDEHLAYVAEHMETLEGKKGEFLYQVSHRAVVNCVVGAEGVY